MLKRTNETTYELRINSQYGVTFLECKMYNLKDDRFCIINLKTWRTDNIENIINKPFNTIISDLCCYEAAHVIVNDVNIDDNKWIINILEKEFEGDISFV